MKKPWNAVQPLFERLVGPMSRQTLNYLSTVPAVIFVADCAVTAVIS
ncbi:MAG: hypothetical protein PUD12_04795 [Firmicutes bacterium]|nr:hypothetical protein [Bacillota bacterium]